MRPRIISQVGTGISAPFPVDWRQQNFQISLICEVVGTATYTIEHTADNIIDARETATPVWMPHATLANKTTTSEGNYTSPITAFRINITSGTGAVNVRFVQQSGS